MMPSENRSTRYADAVSGRCPAPTARRLRAVLLVLPLLLATVTVQAQIPPEEYAQRRAALMEALGDGLYYFEANVAGNGRQDPDFNYLTGILEQNGRLLMVRQRETTREILFISVRRGGSWDPSGQEMTAAGAMSNLEVRPLTEFEDVVSELMRQRPSVLIAPLTPMSNERVAAIFEQMSRMGRLGRGGETSPGIRLVNPARTLTNLRGVKSPAEIELIQIASDITSQAQIAAMTAAVPGMNEFELQAVIEYTFKRYGSQRPGFDTIVGSGPNSSVLHWSQNDRFMEAGDVVVMDIGAEYFGYTSDVTRTIPVSGIFTREQRDIYEVVLAAHLAAAELAETEGTPYSRLNQAANEVLAEGLARLGLIESADATLPGGRRRQLSLHYYHGLGHGIGLIVHDSMPEGSMIIPGACFTIEPGIYVRPDVLDMLGEGEEADALRRTLEPAVRKYQNIGIRIEDSYAFTENGLVRLSIDTPRTIEEVEAAMARPNIYNQVRIKELVELFRRFRPPER